MKKTLALALGLVLVATPALAFHDAGVAHCNGCHTMHNSQDGILVDPDSPGGNEYLLNDATPSDVCLGCHAEGLGRVFDSDGQGNPAPLKGAGNFIFLLEDNINDGHEGGLHPITGDAAGHNLNAPGFGLAPDATLATAPGGGFPADNLGCSSCHDPHGNGNFRLLYGPETRPGFAPAPVAQGLSVHFGTESDANHTAYQGGMSEWCGSCHGAFHDKGAGASPYLHPSGRAMGGAIAGVYNAYNGTDDQDGGVAATAYLAAVPFEDPLMTTDGTFGPSGTSEVSCITCHRAHATSAPDAGRWDFNVTFLHEDGAESGSYPIPDPYSSVNQRSLCNKCHNKDAGDAPFTP